MPGKELKIHTAAYCHIGGKPVNMDELTSQQRVIAAAWLKCTYLNEMYRGKASFAPEDPGILERAETHMPYPGNNPQNKNNI